MATDCLFCRIRDRAIPSKIVFEDDQVLAFRDVAPQAPHHMLVIPKRHMTSLKDATPADAALIGHIHLVARSLAEKEGFADQGYRIVVNTGADGGQSVFHLHFHILGGRHMQWPPG
jgi:histidine triad (HIT) family protein